MNQTGRNDIAMLFLPNFYITMIQTKMQARAKCIITDSWKKLLETGEDLFHHGINTEPIYGTGNI